MTAKFFDIIFYFLIGIAISALSPEQRSMTDQALFVGILLLVLILDLRSYDHGIQKGREIVWHTLAETFQEKGIESVIIKKTTQENDHGSL